MDGGEDFEAVAEDEDEVGAGLLEGVGKSDDATAGGAGDVGRGVAGEGDVDFPGDGEAVGFDGAPGFAEFRGEVHAGDEELEVEARGGLDAFEDAVEEAEIGPRTGDDADDEWFRHGS